ncbi:capsid maturation protease and MuF-like fusion protein [Mycobacterium phage Daisy]|nr:capsid maturation protease and MuF-like fusion protein [Mycobacterium phage Daisy]QAY13627.1 capsid maturation protease and MuF-like fusion protein [Mycobacterium phage RomaT]
MWPEPGEALSRTIEAEWAVEDLYALAIQQWTADVMPFVLPALTAAGDHDMLPPDIDAVVTEGTGFWSRLAEKFVLPGVVATWCLSVVQAFRGITGDDLPAPDEVSDPPEIDPAVYRTIRRSIGVRKNEVDHAMRVVESNLKLRAARDDFLERQRPRVERFPAEVREKLDLAIQGSEAFAPSEVRMLVQDVMIPGGEEMRSLAREAGYQAAAIQNDAVLTAGLESAAESEETLQKVWIATIDGKTRPSHWAADGQRAPIDGKFTVGGEDLSFPADPSGSPAEVKNCRCRMGILAEDEELPDEVDRHTERLDGRDSTARNRAGSQADEIERRREQGNVRARDTEDGRGRVAAGGWAAPSEETLTMGADDTKDETETFRTFTNATLAILGKPTSDGRMLDKDIKLSFREFPLPVMWCRQTTGGHTDAYTVGVLESAEVKGNKVIGSGYLLNTAEADEAAEQLAHGVTSPSVDLASAKWRATDAKGMEITEDDYRAAYDKGEEIDVVVDVYEAELTGFTLVAIAAFGDTALSLDAERSSKEPAVVAAAATKFRPRVYSAELFSDPKLTEPTRSTMDPETGRIFGHIACFGTCHRSIQAQCLMAPKSPTNYSQFLTSPPVLLDNGERIPVGRLTVGTGHAPENLSGGPAVAHYDNTGTCFALVNVGEDEHGIWFSGVAAPWATPEQIEMGLSAPLSGDWRDFGHGLDLVAALAVNTPGFTASGREDSDGRPVSLVASLGPSGDAEGGIAGFTLSDIEAAVQRAVALALDSAKKAEADAAAAAKADELFARAVETVGPPPTEEDKLSALLARAASSTQGGQ